MKSKLIVYFLNFALIPLLCGMGYLLIIALVDPTKISNAAFTALFRLMVFIPLPYILFSLLCSLLFDSSIIIMISASGISLLLISQLYRIYQWPYHKWLLFAGTVLTLAAAGFFVYGLLVPDEERVHKED